jgi:hypothetical protein
MAPILRMYRYALAGIPADMSNAVIAAGTWAVAVFVLGTIWFISYEGKMARYL